MLVPADCALCPLGDNHEKATKHPPLHLIHPVDVTKTARRQFALIGIIIGIPLHPLLYFLRKAIGNCESLVFSYCNSAAPFSIVETNYSCIMTMFLIIPTHQAIP